ncbi:GNAT family N-acetyltransferase [Fusobacterium periodonticum]|jgi:acetyltransferase|uniref:GNAT family N-acetyltransferase n=1 Tax=Fusobacterium periodonticum TaxID=860 RepID=UPI001956CB15|nr:GNAT family N-acetyltransferase [Fusobacterium periodonticum]VTX67949.1 Acetyltransferase (GNAT) domain protein [Fusobacterium periodonticum]
MKIELIRASLKDTKEIWKMQVKSFKNLLDKYQDFETNPASETILNVEMRLKQNFTFFYFIFIDNKKVGAIRVVDYKEKNKNKRISPLFILPEYRNKGIAQSVIKICEEIHGNTNWELSTILEEKGNCYLYEKLGYHPTGKTQVINDRLTLIFYHK